MNLLNTLVVKTLRYIPKSVIGAVASRYIAGETLPDAMNKVRQLNGENALATVDVLGEDIFTQDQATESKYNSVEVLNAIAKLSLNSNLSVKLTSLGLKMEKQFCIGNMDEIVSTAKRQNNFVRIDMEDHTCTDDTLEVYRVMRSRYSNVGIVIQAYLHRSEGDIRALAAERTNVRLCKGIYNEPPQVAIKDRVGIQQNYLTLLRILFEAGCYVGIATHDDVLIDGAKKMIVELNISKDKYEYQMLLGVRDEKRKQLIAEGHRLRVYVPFGRDWYGYSVRRLKENPQMAGHVFKAMFGIGQ
ncbi:MAG: proline dehydrogenase family protein [Ignavibacteriales bacterium]|nr:proline dehydrogenase family protein [Ignavibacteriales bacterium]